MSANISSKASKSLIFGNMFDILVVFDRIRLIGGLDGPVKVLLRHVFDGASS
jgi:hypothetical protein